MKAKEDYKEFCRIFNGIPFGEVEKTAKSMNLYFGADYGCELVDINFKSIIATCVNRNGFSKVSPDIEVYDEDGQRIYCGDIKEV